VRRIEYMSIAELERAERNPKAHARADMTASVDRFGWIEGLVIDERTSRLVAGHGRLEEARARHATGEGPPAGVVEEGVEWKLPVVRGWASRDDAEAEAAGLALNRLVMSGGWRRQELYELLDAMDDDQGLTGTGFTSEQMTGLLADLEESIAYDPEGPKRGQAAGVEESYAERLAKYKGKGVRSLVLDFPVAQFERLAPAAAKARAEHGVDTNAELLVRLLEPWR
jgi:hypothetical protein